MAQRNDRRRRPGSAYDRPQDDRSRYGGPRYDRPPDARAPRTRPQEGTRLTRRGRVLAGLLSLAAVLGGAYASAGWQGDAEPSAPWTAEARPSSAAGAAGTAGGQGDRAAGEVSSDPPSRPRDAEGRAPRVPETGSGTFAAAGVSGTPVGSGTLRRYEVQVEEGSGVSADEAAAEIQAIVAHPLGWARNGRGRFQLVTGKADFVIRIATPGTADRLCAEAGLDTGGQLNCETGKGVVVNLRRWLLGSPQFTGPPAQYRHLIINHELGHALGLGHLGCPGPGRPAPVMMQQIKGLDGCRSNAWPYGTNRAYLSGPTL
ncbi:DUF3152 domain-containing protein [Streptomyces candidus]|uniref:DUF3152 domain-containing protein n=1 Tax=Streptomyces candidus TaxID=67283 RepID=A0A7X0LRH4_9ACTN|nr:DUF3152 domain-containing protein [Streptomyces candidus]MBB6438135.1 hypothetical protein [Streptomyces candidus]GHH39161.1 hypothetical protein GCM10018773_18610 [Streptomyces candidus]